MKFRKLIIALIFIVVVFFSFNILCTWKVKSLQGAYMQRENNNNLEDVNKALGQEYGEGNPVFSTPFGDWTYHDIEKKSLAFGPDLQGGRIITVAMKQKEFLQSIGKTDNTTFKTALDETEEIVEKDDTKSFLDTFLERLESKGKTLAYYFEATSIKKTDSNTYVKEWIKNRYKTCLEQCEATLSKRLRPTDTENVTISKGEDTLEIQTDFQQSEKDLKEWILIPGKLNFHECPNQEKSDLLYKKLEKELKKESESEASINTDQGRYYYSPKDKDAIKKVAQKILSKNQAIFFYKNAEENGKYMFIFVKTHKNPVYSKNGYNIDKAKVEKLSPEEKIQNKGDAKINVTLNKESAENFKRFTGDAPDGLKPSEANPIILAITLDDTVLMTPRLTQELSGEFSITGGFSFSEARKIADTLQSGSMPVSLKIIADNTISPSLGQEARNQGFFSIWIALLLLFLLMGVYYAKSGLYANTGLVFNIVFILGFMAQFGIPLTLAGIAGLLLTLGMAVDANIIIFSGARAALKTGKSPRESLREGYKNAYKSLLGSNVTTFLAGLILFFFGSENPTIREFSKTLLLGLFTSFVAAVVLVQLFFDLFFAFRGPLGHVSFSFRFTNLFQNIQIDLLGKRKRGYLLSFFFLVTGLGLLFYNGMNISTDFTGGTRYCISFDTSKKVDDGKDITASDLEKALKEELQGSIQVNAINGRSNQGNRFSIVTNEKQASNDELHKKIYDLLYKITGKTFSEASERKEGGQNIPKDSFIVDSKSTIGGSMANAMKSKSILAIILALLGMLIFIFATFGDFGFSLATLIALSHDILAIFASIGFAKLFGFHFEMDLTLYICLLTIFGYSINDTILFFISLVNQVPDKDTKNIGPYINKTFAITFERIFMTSFSTALPLLIMLLLGGIGLQAFSFALLAGVFWGTLSSILAPPLAYDINNAITFIKRKFGRKKVGKHKMLAMVA